MKTIPLTQGRVTLVEDSDYDYLSRFSWHYSPSIQRGKEYPGYACTNMEFHGKRRPITMHQLLLPKCPNMLRDHINRDKLDNRRANLRYVTKSTNNRNAHRRDNSTGFPGIYSRAFDGKVTWMAHARLNGQKYHLGSFDSLDAAVTARTTFVERLQVGFVPVKSLLQVNNTSGFEGVYLFRGGWVACLRRGGKSVRRSIHA